MFRFFTFLLALLFSAQVALATTTTVFPDAGTGGTTVDGWARMDGVDQSYATIIAGAGNSSLATLATSTFTNLNATSTSNQYTDNRRSIFTFDTSSISALDNIDDATLSLEGTAQQNGLGEPDLHVVSASPAADNNLANGDYATLGSTSFGSVAYGSYSTSGYNDITLNASGEANINAGGITRFGTKDSWDVAGSFGGSWSSGQVSNFTGKFADTSGTSSDPKLVVNHSEPVTFIPQVIFY